MGDNEYYFIENTEGSKMSGNGVSKNNNNKKAVNQKIRATMTCLLRRKRWNEAFKNMQPSNDPKGK